MIDLNDFIEKERPDSNGKRKLYKFYCNKCGKDRGYKRKTYKIDLCHGCANDVNYDRAIDKAKYINVDFNDYEVKTYSGKKCKHYKTKCVKCNSNKGYMLKPSWLIPCISCSNSHTEQQVRNIFETKYSKKFPTVRPNFLKNSNTNRNLELDGYCEELKLAFEYDGRMHYEAWDKNKPEELTKTQERDKIKDKLCKDNDIALIRIPYWEKDNLKNYINEQLSRSH